MDYQSILLPHIDIPYFRNNPDYLSSWEKYYGEQKDPHILLLMYHKQIGTFHHWLHLRLAEYFVHINKVELAHFVLTEAISNKVYDQGELKEAIRRLPSFEHRYSRGDMLAVLNQRNIHALGRVWNKFSEKFFYRDNLESGFVDFMMERTDKLERARGRVLPSKLTLPTGNCVSEQHEEGPLFTTTYFFDISPKANDRDRAVVPDDTERCYNTGTDREFTAVHSQDVSQKAAHGTTSAAAECNSKIGETSQHTNTIGAEAIQMESRRDADTALIPQGAIECVSSEAKDKEDSCLRDIKRVHVDSDTVLPATEISLSDFIYIVREVHKDWFIAIRVAKESDAAKTVVGLCDCFRKIDRRSASLLSRLEDYEYCMISGDLYVVFECDFLCTLEDALKICEGDVAYLYLKQVLRIVEKYEEKNVAFTSAEFFVDGEFRVNLFSFVLAESSPETRRCTESIILSLFDTILRNVECNLKSLVRVSEEALASEKTKLAVIKHKTALLEKL